MENFEKLVERVRNMICYGMSLEVIHSVLTAEGVEECFIYFAYRGAQLMDSL